MLVINIYVIFYIIYILFYYNEMIVIYRLFSKM